MSKSLRISDPLFSAAQDVGGVLSRSAADQVEHWARLGLALEQNGLTVSGAISLFGMCTAQQQSTLLATDDLWAQKRARQKLDVQAVERGERESSDMAWFGSAVASRATLVTDVF